MTHPLKIVSWNINSVNARLERLSSVLDRHQPDVICLQELKCVTEKFPLAPFRERGYECTVLGQKTYNGVAVCSKIPILKAQFPMASSPFGGEARAVGALVQGVWVYSVYVPNGQSVESPKYSYKLNWLETLWNNLNTLHEPTDPITLCGDFNIAPAEIDVHNPKEWEDRVLFSVPERTALAKYLQRYTDTFRLLHSGTSLFSWWDYRKLAFPFNKGLRIDLILASEVLAAKCTLASIDRDERKGSKPSDHAPIIAEFAID